MGHKETIIEVLAVFTVLSASICKAEKYQIDLTGEDLHNIAAVEIGLSFDPPGSFVIDKYFEINRGNFLFKTVDEKLSLIRIFFSRPLDVTQTNLVIKGKLNRVNFTGDPKVNISSTKYIADFSLQVDPKKMQSELTVSKNDLLLPYMGITKAEILGPNARIFSNKMFIAVTNIETYGFEWNRSIKNAKINGVKAKFINDKILTAYVPLTEVPSDHELDVEIEIDVDKLVIKKNVGTIKIIDSIE